MGEALVAGLVSAGWAAPDELAVVEKLAARRDALQTTHPGVVVVDDLAALDGSPDAAVIAVKPGDVSAACAVLGRRGVGRVLSIAAGVTIAAIEQSLGTDAAVVRAMPNTPALVGAGAAAIAGGTHA